MRVRTNIIYAAALAIISGYATYFAGNTIYYCSKVLCIVTPYFNAVLLHHCEVAGAAIGITTGVFAIRNTSVGAALGASLLWIYCSYLSLFLCEQYCMHGSRFDYWLWFSAAGFMVPVTLFACIALWMVVLRERQAGQVTASEE